MRKIYLLIFFIYSSLPLFGQSTDAYPSNLNISTLEKNALFYANKRYSVSQTGIARLDSNMIFDGGFSPSYTSVAPSETNPTIVLIENFPNVHVQSGAWIGWSTRTWGATKFKIEVYNTFANANIWVTVADISNYIKNDFAVKLSNVQPSKIRFTFYTASGTTGRLGISELFYIHPEAAQAYDGLMLKYDNLGDVKINSFKNIKLGNVAFLQEQNAIENGNDRAMFAQGATWDNTNKRYDLNSNKVFNRNGVILGNDGVKFFGHSGNVTTTPYWSNTEMGANTRMIVHNNGNVGIGVSVPNKKLVVQGEIGLGNSDGLSYNGIRRTGVATEYFNTLTGVATNIIHNFTNNVGGSLLSITNGGNIGIGTITPTTKFEILDATGITLRHSQTVNTAGTFRIFGGAYSSNKLNGLVFNTAATYNQISVGGGTALGETATLINFYTTPTVGTLNVGEERMRINNLGQVGIGTTTIPTDYRLAVAGNVIAEKIKVKKQSSGWPDFVFSPNYKLPSLTEVEAFVIQNSHLSEIPSANEIEKDGQDLGEMNRLLLKKVEELTLYLIEQSKEIKLLKSKVEQLEKK
jgi:hypothetical protein